jgi:hypothetical protein
MSSKFKQAKWSKNSVFSILYSKYAQIQIDLADKCQLLKFSNNKLAREEKKRKTVSEEDEQT